MHRVPQWALWLLFGACVFRLWIMPLPSSFWVDEAGTMFVVRAGANHPSFAVAPQVPASVYFWLPRAADWLLQFLPSGRGVTETVYRLPSVLAMGLALFLLARIAARLIHPAAGWFTVFAALGLRGLNYEADDARPYALGILVTAAAVYFLLRWLDHNRFQDALLFVVAAALIWRVHLVDWSFYAVLALYAAVRLLRRDTPVPWWRVLVAFGAVGVALVPVLVQALGILRQAGEHVIAPVPPVKELVRALKFGLLLEGAAVAVMLRFRHGTSRLHALTADAAALVGGWWLIPPIAIFAFSHLTGNSVFVNRYLSFGLPGVALATAAAAAVFLPPLRWNWAALLFGAGVLLLQGDWRTSWPVHHNSDWRGAAEAVNRISVNGEVPILCPSPFIEAHAPVWSPSYPLPGFLYSHLATYPVHGRLLLLPFAITPEATRWVAGLEAGTLVPGRHFAFYGSVGALRPWLEWARREPAFQGWRIHRLGDHGDVAAWEFDGRGRAQ